MNAPRETIVAALMAHLSTLTAFKTIKREWKGSDDSLTSDALPALYLIERDEQHMVRGRGMPAKVDWPFDIVVVIAKRQGQIGEAVLNPLLDQLDTIFCPSVGQRAAGVSGIPGALASLVYDAWIEGKVAKNAAFLGGAAALFIAPLHVRTYNPS